MATNERIPLQRAYAIVGDDRIAIYPSRAQVVGSLIELAIAGVAIVAMVSLFDVLPMFVLIALLLLALFLGPIGTLGLVFSIAGTAFLMERAHRAARWQQGFLGMGIGTTDGVPFTRIAAVEVASDGDLALRSGERQDVITFEVVIARDDGKRMPVASVVSARVFAEDGAERANRLATVLAEMAGVPTVLAAVPDEDAEDETEAVAERPRRRYRRVTPRDARRGGAE